jgi:hypothetical protein
VVVLVEGVDVVLEVVPGAMKSPSPSGPLSMVRIVPAIVLVAVSTIERLASE